MDGSEKPDSRGNNGIQGIDWLSFSRFVSLDQPARGFPSSTQAFQPLIVVLIQLIQAKLSPLFIDLRVGPRDALLQFPDLLVGNAVIFQSFRFDFESLDL